MVSFQLPEIMPRLITFENILSVLVLEELFIMVVCKVNGINELEAR